MISWLDSLAAAEVATTAITAAELLYGVAKLPGGHRKAELTTAVQGLLRDDFQGRVLAFGEHAAGRYADIVTTRERLGRPIGVADAQIAAICRTVDAMLATRNTTDFEEAGIELINPGRWATRPVHWPGPAGRGDQLPPMPERMGSTPGGRPWAKNSGERSASSSTVHRRSPTDRCTSDSIGDWSSTSPA